MTPDTECARCGHAKHYHHRLTCGWTVRGPWPLRDMWCTCPAFVEPDATETIVIW
jgi:hypothetical protein